MNPFDEIAVEEAVRLKEKGKVHGDRRRLHRARQVAGDHPHRAVDGRRSRHPDRDAEGQAVEPLSVAKLLKGVIDAEKPAFIILGKQAIDDDCNQTGQMLAALLGWPQATFASKLVIEGRRRLVTREVDGGLETLKIKLPAVVTTDLRLNEPRYPSLPNIMKAKKKPLDMKKPADYRRRYRPAPQGAEDGRAGRPQGRCQGGRRGRADRQAERDGGAVMSVLLVAEHDNAALGASNAKAMSAAKALGGDVHVLIAGANCKAVAEAATKLDGVVQGAAGGRAAISATRWPRRWPR